MATIVNHTCKSFIKLTPGLLDAATSDDFDAILLSLKQPWAERESRKDGRLDEGKGFHNEKLHDSRCANEGGSRFSSG